MTGGPVDHERVPPLARSTVDRAALRRRDPQWLAAAWQRARVLVIDASGRALCRLPRDGAVSTQAEAAAALVLHDPSEAPEVSPEERLFLGVDPAGVPYFAVVADLPEPDAPAAAGAPRPVSLREVGALLDARDAGLLTTAVALANWHTAHRFSPVSGAATTVAEGGWLRVDGAGGHLFPRTDPAVIVLVHDGAAGPQGRCLLGRNAAWRTRPDGRRFFSILAGYVEPGESAEAAVAREVHEEVGVHVSGLRYQGSQAWPFPGSLMLGFTGLADPGQPLALDPVEIAEARWFTRGEVAELLSEPPGAEIGLPGPASIAHFLITRWLDGAPSA